MEVHGFKAFNYDMTNRYGVLFEEGKTYTVNPPISYGIFGNGIHFAKRLEDTLRFVDGMREEVKIAMVTGSGDIISIDDLNNGYDDLFVAERIVIDKILTREEVIKIMLNKGSLFAARFISGYRLNLDEIAEFKERFFNDDIVLNAISYYQDGDLDVYNREFLKKKRQKL